MGVTATEVLERLEGMEKSLREAVEQAVKGALEDFRPMASAQQGEDAPAPEQAAMRQPVPEGLAQSLDNLGGLGVPIGSALVGGIPGVIVGEVVDGITPLTRQDGSVNWTNIAV